MTDKNATKTEMRNEIASIRRDVTYPVFFGRLTQILQNRDDTLLTRGGSKGLKLYDEIERDAHAYAMLEKRKNAVIAREWGVDAASDSPRDRAIADELEGMLANIKFDRLCKDMLDANLKGYSVSEIMWRPEGNRIIPSHYFARDQRRFAFDADRQLRMLTPENPIDGEVMPGRKFIVHTVGGKDGSPYGLGLGSKLFWPVFFKKQDITFWLIFADKFGSPTPVGKYPPGTTQGDQDKLLAALQAIATDAAVVIPEGMQADLLEAQRSGAGDFYERLARYMDEQISEVVTGETLTTTVSSSGGNRALGEVHNEVRMEVAKGDADLLSDTLNETLIKWIVDLNWPGAEPPTVWRDFSEAEDLKVRAERDKTLEEMGWELTEEEFIRVYGDGYRRKQQPTPAAPTVSAPVAKRANALGEDESSDDLPEFNEQQQSIFKRIWNFLTFAEANGDIDKARKQNRTSQQEIADGSDVAAEQWQSFMQPRIAELHVLLEETSDLVQFRERLDELLNSEPPAEFIEQLARAQFAAHIIGRGKAE